MVFMKKVLTVIMALLLVLSFAACQDTQTSTTPGNTDTTAGSTQPSETPTQEQKSAAELLYGDGCNNNMIVGVDQFGRTFDISFGDRENKDVGMFFWLWIGQPYASDIYDATKILEEYGKDVLFHQSSDISPDGQPHYWGEPLWGYYNSNDEYVIRKQIELLTAAGVDFIVFDTTNALTYRAVYTKIAKIISEFIADGWNPPRIAFYTHSQSLNTVRQLYKEFYSKNLYPETWYMVEGKPFIIAYTEVWRDKVEAQSRGDNNYNPEKLSDEIKNFFYFRNPNWPGENLADGFPWCEWTYPQPVHNNMINVTVASHPMVPMSFSLTRENWCNWGRGYNVTTGQNVSEDAEKGTFFQSQWDVALKEDPDTVFVGGWNEWIAYKQIYDGEYMLCDAASMEYSRDIEMMKGGYNDAFYIQLIQNMRKYKGTQVDTDIDTGSKTVDITGSASQWDDVTAVYRDIGKANYDRDAYGGTRKIKYTMEAPRNNLQTVKVTKDSDNIYFYIESDADITANDGKGNWMNIFLTAGETRNTGWVCYDYVINRTSENGVASVERLDESGSGTKVGEARISVSGKVMQVALPRNTVGLESSDEFYFKVADGVENPTDIMDYYVTGRCLPMGRLSYKFVG